MRQVQQHLLEPKAIPDQAAWQRRVDLKHQWHRVHTRPARQDAVDLFEQAGQHKNSCLKLQRARSCLGPSQQVVDQHQQPFGRAFHTAGQILLLWVECPAQQKLVQADDGGQRCAQFVADRSQEAPICCNSRLGLLPGQFKVTDIAEGANLKASLSHVGLHLYVAPGGGFAHIDCRREDLGPIQGVAAVGKGGRADKRLNLRV